MDTGFQPPALALNRSWHSRKVSASTSMTPKQQFLQRCRQNRHTPQHVMTNNRRQLQNTSFLLCGLHERNQHHLVAGEACSIHLLPVSAGS
jgi:ribosomal protein L39E